MILTKWLTQKIINIALANDKTEKKDFFCYSTYAFNIAFIIVKTPLVDHPNKRFTETEKQILKQKNYLFISIVTFAEIVFCCTNYAIYYKLITISCFITVLNILAGIFKNRKEAYSSCYLK